MASTDAKSGFRLPWSTDRNDSTDPATETGDQTVDESQPHAVDETPAAPETGAADVGQEQAYPAPSAAAEAGPTWDAPAAGAASAWTARTRAGPAARARRGSA